MIGALLLLGAVAWADEVRLGVFVGNDEGRGGQEKLLFATADARKMRDLFVAYGQMAPGDAQLLLDRSRRDVEQALVEVRRRVDAAEALGQRATVIFYYSGHGDDEGLQLGAGPIPHEELRGWLEATGADVRIALLDACQSGAAVREKGGVRGPAHEFAIAATTARGTAFLTSSAASELSQESEDLGGGFFTYYLHSGLLGAADADADGVVTLTEAYDYVHGETAFHSRGAPETQTPGFDYDLSGSGEVVLTRLEAADAALVFDGALDGSYAVWDEGRKRYVAEVKGDQPVRLALPRGTYYVHHRMPGWVDEAVYALGPGEAVTVSEVDFLTMAWDDTASRGDLRRQVRKATTPELNLQALVGVRTFGTSVYGTQYIPAHAVAGVQARFLQRRRGPYWGFDVLTGGGSGTVSFAVVGPQGLDVRSYSAGGVAGWASGAAIVRAGAGGRVEVVHFQRVFDDDVPPQASTSVAPGVNTWAGLHWGRVNVDLGWNLLLLPVRWDDHPMPAFSEVSLSFGYRF